MPRPKRYKKQARRSSPPYVSGRRRVPGRPRTLVTVDSASNDESTTVIGATAPVGAPPSTTATVSGHSAEDQRALASRPAPNQIVSAAGFSGGPNTTGASVAMGDAPVSYISPASGHSRDDVSQPPPSLLIEGDVWIVGDSIVRRAATSLGCKPEVHWKGLGGARYGDVA
ncbi:uncharacterized protein LOC119738134 [Patiria miniata]|uniref:Uncharacterized protein n=1 Tax=Patiria miniata TaxID=46514 RepID=A0A914AYM4_PATMI|nr:uncharacterized protein LOC119738134 [Patiria miniata]